MKASRQRHLPSGATGRRDGSTSRNQCSTSPELLGFIWNAKRHATAAANMDSIGSVVARRRRGCIARTMRHVRPRSRIAGGRLVRRSETAGVSCFNPHVNGLYRRRHPLDMPQQFLGLGELGPQRFRIGSQFAQCVRIVAQYPVLRELRQLRFKLGGGGVRALQQPRLALPVSFGTPLPLPRRAASWSRRLGSNRSR